ncbi:MAG: TonB-dependent receptor domain-containing protein [Nevskiales bacterium]
MTRKSLVIALLWAVASRPLLAQDETTPEPDTPAPESASAIAKPDGDGAPATTDSATPPSSAEGDTAPTTNRGASAAAAVGLEELDAILAEEPADPATAAAAQGDGAPATTDNATPPSSAEGGTAPTTSSTKRAPVTVGLEEIIVTATKREKSLRDIPASIRAFDGRDLEAKAILSINEVLETTPGVTSNSIRPGDQRIIMRGISTTASATTTAPFPVGIFIGDTALNEPYAASITPDLSAFDLAGVEILKGPQGTLFGGAALTGAIRYRLNEPIPDAWQLRAFSQYTDLKEGSTALTNGVAVNVPIAVNEGGLGLRLVYIDREYPGVYDDLRPEQAAQDVDQGRGEQIRVGALWRPSDRWHLKFTYLDQDYAADNGLVLADERQGPRETRVSLLPWPNRHQFGLYNLEFQYDFDSMRLVSSTSRTEKERHNIIDTLGTLLGTPPPGTPDSLALPFITDQDSTSFSQELRLQSLGSGGLEWLIGGYYYRAPINYALVLNLQLLQDLGRLAGDVSQLLAGLNQTLTNLAGPGNPLSQLIALLSPTLGQLPCELAVLCAETRAKAREDALFFDLSYSFWDRLELSAGARFYRTAVDGGFIGRGVAARLIGNGMSPVDVRSSLTEEGVNPKLSATYRFTESVSLYALASRGFRFGGIQNIPPDEAQNVPATFKSDSLWNYELGLRTAWFGNTMHFDITRFHIDYKDPQVQLQNLVRLNYYDNVGAAVSDGVEASFEWLTPIPGIALSASGGVVDAHTTEPFLAGQTPVPAGVGLPGSAEKQYSGQISYFWPFGGPLTFGAAISYAYVGKTAGALQVPATLNDYGIYSANMQVGSANWPGKPSLTLSVTNLTDVTAPIGGLGSLAGDTFFILNPPRTITARFSLEFE